MSTSQRARTDRLQPLFRPASCYSAGSVCDRVELVGDGSLDPPEPDLPEVCVACGRRIRWQVIVVYGVDVGAI